MAREVAEAREAGEVVVVVEDAVVVGAQEDGAACGGQILECIQKRYEPVLANLLY